VAVALACARERQTRGRMLRQAAFLAIPYLSVLVFLPQVTATHPYFTDVLLLIPGAFVLAVWSLREAAEGSWPGLAWSFWLIGVGLILMTDLLHVAQVVRLRF
jgi:hypothetical protein